MISPEKHSPMPEKEDQEFFELIQQAREEIKTNPDLQAEVWAWIHELDDEGFFIFCYLLEDFNQKIISQKELEETVYTLVMLRHKFIPANLPILQGFSVRWQLQPLFNLYEKLKKEEMSWEDCQQFIDEQFKNLPIRQNN